ncbi:hypothetical protein G6F58_013335 [Rhizopus delemar]|nr:hypothetical protein G6F24_018830 [Rhizopus arrhizus]KAG1389214.1 hypothetical protein G6F58_013335 [Rhizopus delemar]
MGIAAALIKVSGLSPRGLSMCSACATSSLPVPLSPTSNTGTSSGATRRMSSLSWRMALLLPTIWSNP